MNNLFSMNLNPSAADVHPSCAWTAESIVFIHCPLNGEVYSFVGHYVNLTSCLLGPFIHRSAIAPQDRLTHTFVDAPG